MSYHLSKTANSNEYNHRTSVIVSFLIILAILFSTLIITPPVSASSLDDFESAATTDNSQQDSDDNEEDQDQEEHDNNPFCQFLSDFFDVFTNELFQDIFNGIVYLVNEGAEMSLARVGWPTDIDPSRIEIRRAGEAALPYFQVDYKYMRVNSRINAVDDRIEFGNGPFGFEYRNTNFTEINPGDNLNLSQGHLLLRISATRSQEFGMGMGLLTIHGDDQNAGFSLTFPVKIYPAPSFGIKFKPTYSWINGNLINDIDLSLNLINRFGTMELGYRFLEVNGEELNGAYIGLSLHY